MLTAVAAVKIIGEFACLAGQSEIRQEIPQPFQAMTTRTILGSIADDLTGATDLANNLARAGMRVSLTVGVPGDHEPVDAEAVVVALKSRTAPPKEAVEWSLQACRWLKQQGVSQIYFKICSTFDSTAKGNIGPVIEALMDELGCAFCVVVPAFPDNERTVFKGHLFVGDVLLSESGMENHPITPMTDPNLVRFLQAQVERERRKVGLIDHRAVTNSAAAVVRRIEVLRSEGVSIAVADATTNEDLKTLASALHRAPLVSASSGLASHLPTEWGFKPSVKSSPLPPARGRKAIVCGSCSTATRRQVSDFIQKGGAAKALDPLRLAADCDGQIEDTLCWADSSWKDDPGMPLLMYSTAEPVDVQAVQATLGIRPAGEIIEYALSSIARQLVGQGVGQLILAGGETAGQCVQALGVQRMQVGPQIDPGVPWCHASSVRGGLHIALKSGNFGSEHFFTKAFELIQ